MKVTNRDHVTKNKAYIAAPCGVGFYCGHADDKEDSKVVG